MPTRESGASDPAELFDRLQTTDCQYCGGDLHTGTYKGSGAILCQDCGTPAVRVW